MVNEIEIGGNRYFIKESSDVIEKEGRKGKTFWQGHVVRGIDGKWFTCTSSWQETITGLSKVSWSEPYYAEPKNIGKVNETSNEDQAYFEWESMVTKERRVRESVRPLPMLAKVFSERKHKVKYPVAVQPKLDGMRMLSNSEESWSRKNKLWDDQRIIEHIRGDLNGLGERILDGELILPWFPKVNMTMSASKKFGENSPKLKYFVYDMVMPDVPFIDRYKMLESWVADMPRPSIMLVETYICSNEEDVLRWHKDFTDRGFEGTIIRDLNAGYQIGQRVDALLKHKDFVDQEFEIVDIIPAGGGSSADVGKFVCKADNGELFESTATGSEAERRTLLKMKHFYIGKFAKVKYRELTEYGVPFHSNVLEIRETKDEGY